MPFFDDIDQPFIYPYQNHMKFLWVKLLRRFSRYRRGFRRSLRTFLLPKPTHGAGRFRCADHLVKPSLALANGCHLELNGIVEFKSDLGEPGTAVIDLRKNAKLIIDGDFVIGPGVTIIVAENATLFIGGKRNSSGSGVTANSRIMVAKDVHIGYDTIIAWGVCITDCDWHSIIGTQHTKPCKIGNHVWLAHGSSILKGADIANNSIVAAHSVCLATSYPAHSLLAGAPAKVIRPHVDWQRELA